MTDDLIAEYLAKGGTVTKYQDCSPKDAMRRSFKIYKDGDKLRRKKHIPKEPSAIVFSGYNSGKR